MQEHRFDVVVLGGGPGGYVCAIRAAQLGLKTACIEAENVGGVCLNWGCVPSKALISSAHLYTKAQHAAVQGIRIPEVKLDVDALQGWKDGIVSKLVSGIRGLFRGNGVTLFEGRGRLVEPRRVEVTNAQGEVVHVVAERGVVVATGSATIEVPGFEFDGQRVIGAREAVHLHRIPPRLLVVGGGVIGLELGMVYQSFSAQLTVVELTPSLLPGVDPEAVRLVERRIVARGGRVLTSARAESRTLLESGSVSVQIGRDGQTESVECDVVLVAVGMRPRSSGLGLQELGVSIDPRGFVSTDAECRTNVPGVFAIGDVSGPPLLAHKASKEGEVCAEVMAGRAAAKDWVAIPGVVFTDPEIACVGLSEAQAREKGHTVRVGKFPFAALGRALSLGETDGFCKVVMDQQSGRILGIHIVGPSASDLVSEAVLALEMGATSEDLALTVHPHPTLGESLMEASAASLGHAIHVINR